MPEEIRPSSAVGRKTSDETPVSRARSGYRATTKFSAPAVDTYRVMDGKFVCIPLLPRYRLAGYFKENRIILAWKFVRLHYVLLHRVRLASLAPLLESGAQRMSAQLSGEAHAKEVGHRRLK